jgi:hypothetical protein
MEALVAVGLAGNVVQFVQGAGSLIALSAQIRKTNQPKCLPDLRNIAGALMDGAALLRSRLKAYSASLAEEDQVRAC